MRKYIFLLLFLLSCMFVLADNLNPIYLKDYNLSMPCKLNGNDCPNTVNCDLTVWYPNLTIMLSNKDMAYSQGYFYYFINGTNFTAIGDYKSDITCNDSTYNQSYIFNLDVSKKQILSSDSNFVSESKLIAIFISLIAFFIFLGVFFSIKDANLKYLFFLMALVTIDAFTYFGYTISDSISSRLTNVMYRFYWVMLILTVLVLFLMLIDLTRKYLAIKKQKAMYAKDYYGDMNRYG